MRQLLFILTITCLLACEKQESSIVLSALERDILEYVNAYRSSQGLTELEAHSIVQEEAQGHSVAMANGKRAYSHDGFPDRSLRLKEEIRGSNTAEVIAKDLSTALAITTFWRGQEETQTKITGDFNLVGISSKQSEKGTYYHTLLLFKSH